jgi:Rod binding domain-containing protein
MTPANLQLPTHINGAGATGTSAISAAAAKKHAELVRQTQKWVAQAFYGTLFRQMQQDPFKSKLFDGGHGGEMFTEMLDQNLSERMARGAPNKLVNSIVSKIEGGKASATYLRHSKLPTPGSGAPQYHLNAVSQGSNDVSSIG